VPRIKADFMENMGEIGGKTRAIRGQNCGKPVANLWQLWGRYRAVFRLNWRIKQSHFPNFNVKIL
jgi:hypothetical protein